MLKDDDTEDPAKEDDSTSEDNADLDKENPDANLDTPDGGDVSGKDGLDGDDDGDPDEDDEERVPKSRLDSVIQERNDLRKREETYLELLGKKGDGSDATKKEKVDAKKHALDLSKYDEKALAEAEALVNQFSGKEKTTEEMKALREELSELKKAQEDRTNADLVEKDKTKLRSALKQEYAKGVTEKQIKRHLERLESSGDSEQKALARGPYKYVIQDYKEWEDKNITSKKKKAGPKIEKSSDSPKPKPDAPGRKYDRSSPIAARAALGKGAREFYESTGGGE